MKAHLTLLSYLTKLSISLAFCFCSICLYSQEVDIGSEESRGQQEKPQDQETPERATPRTATALEEDNDKIEHRSFIYSIGTNFDFIDKISVDKTYHDLQVYLPSIGSSKVGLDVRINRYRTISLRDTTFGLYRTIDAQLNASDTDTTLTLSYINNKMTQTTSIKLDNVGLFVAPTFRMCPCNENDDFHFDFVVSFEWLRVAELNKINRTYESEVFDSPPSDWPRPYQLVSSLPPSENQFRSRTDNFFYGFGFNLHYKNDFGILKLRATMGYVKMNRIEYLEALILFKSMDRTWAGLAMEVIEHKKTGIKIGAELREFIGVNKSVGVVQNMARFNLYIAKEFRLEKIAELLKP